MKDIEIFRYLNKEVLIILKDGYRNYGQIEAVENGTTVISTPEGQLSVQNEQIALIRTKKVRWSWLNDI